MNAVKTVGFHLQLTDARTKLEDCGEMKPTDYEVPEEVRVGDYPLLRAAAWQLDDDARLNSFEALRTYERNWRHLDHTAMGNEEKALLQALLDRYNKGVLLV